MKELMEANQDIISEEELRAEILAQVNDEQEIVRETIDDYLTADYKFEILKTEIEEFQSKLTDEYDVAIAMASFGKDMVMQVTEIGYQNPDLMYFYGYVDGHEAQLIQHISQLNFLLQAVPKENPNAKARRIGFK